MVSFVKDIVLPLNLIFRKFWMLLSFLAYGEFELGWESRWKRMESSLMLWEFHLCFTEKININLNSWFDFKFVFVIFVYFSIRLHSLLRLRSWRRTMLAYNVGIVITFITFLLLWFVHCSDFTWIFFFLLIELILVY